MADDLISRSALMESLSGAYLVPVTNSTVKIVEFMGSEIRKRILAVPAVDAVEVVRCKDCKHHEDEDLKTVYCPNIVGGWVDYDFHCGYGERRGR